MKSKRQMSLSVKAGLAMALFAMGILFTASAAVADDKADAQATVERAKATFDTFMADKNYDWLHKHLADSKGLVIFPEVLKAGFIFGGSGGTGVLVVRNEKTGDWSQPAFYTIGSVTFGLQIGGQAAQVIMMARTDRAINSLFTSGFKLGADTSIALGPVGAGAEANVMADFVSFSMTKGAYAGLNLEGSMVKVRNGMNEAYYGKKVSPVDIIVKKDVSNKGADPLLEDLKEKTQ
jgi:lipid-binding SYLF domain-containing protein